MEAADDDDEYDEDYEDKGRLYSIKEKTRVVR